MFGPLSEGTVPSYLNGEHTMHPSFLVHLHSSWLYPLPMAMRKALLIYSAYSTIR